jgi:hypothetical protein
MSNFSKNINPDPNMKFWKKISVFDEAESRGQGGQDYTAPWNMSAEGLGGSNEETPYDGDILKKGPTQNNTMDRKGLESESDISDLSLGSLGYQSTNGK